MEYFPEAAIHSVVFFIKRGDLSEEFDVEYGFEILFTVNKDNASVSALADEEKKFSSGRAKKNLLVLFVCIPKAFIIRLYSPTVVLFEEAPY